MSQLAHLPAVRQPAAEVGLACHVPRAALAAGASATWWQAEGTLVFADISGFTRLSERLTGHGRAGAEEVTAVINRAFTELLGVAFHHDGDVLKFGGDAILLLFTGVRHARRACQAAVRMRAALAALPAVEAPGGRVRLRMSVGIHTGSFPLFLAGTSHRELIVTGPVPSGVVAMESAASAGQILVSRAVAATLDSTVLGRPLGEGILLRRAPQGGVELPLQLTPWRRRTDADEADRFVPLALRERAIADSDAEHRVAAVAFVKFRGTDACVAASSNGAAASLDELISAAQTVAAAHGVALLATDIDTDGGKLIFCAGVPSAAEDDAGRLLRAMRDLVARPLALQVAAGVHVGQLFAGEVGAPTRRCYTVMGDTVNTAARLAAKAEAGAVVASVLAVDMAAPDFKVHDLGALTVKGKARSIPAVVVGNELTTTSASPLAAAPFIGREVLCARLDAFLAMAEGSTGRVVVISGEMGMGKSRLVAEAVAAHPRLRRHRVFASRYETETPWFVVGGLLRSVLGIGSDHAEEARLDTVVRDRAPHLVPWLPLLGVPLGLRLTPTPEVAALDPQFVPLRLVALVEDLLAACEPEATLFVIEQSQWMDDASATLLSRLAAARESRPWLFFLLRRSGSGAATPEPDEVIDVPPLTAAEATALVDAVITDPPLPRDEVDKLVRLAGGSPLFLLELLAARRAGSTELPHTIEELITARIDRLPPDERQVLRDLSVLGPSFPLTTAHAVAAGDDGSPARLESRGLATFLQNAGEQMWFRQELLRQVAYEGLPFSRRRRLHARVVRLLADADLASAGLLSMHAERAGMPREAWQHGRIAAEAARTNHAPAEAAMLYRRALAAARRIPELATSEVCVAWEALGDVCELTGRYDEADRAYRSAGGDVAPDPAVRVRLLRKRGELRERTGRYSAALRWYREGLRAVAAVPDPRAQARERAALRIAAAGVHQRRGRSQACLRCCQQAVADAKAAQDRALTAHAWYLLEQALSELGRYDEIRYQALDIFAELEDPLGQARTLNNMGIHAYFTGRWSAARGHWERARTLFAQGGDVVGAATALNNAAEIFADQGHHDAARARFSEAATVFRAAGYPIGLGLATSNLGYTAARSGADGEALVLLGNALAILESIGARALLAQTLARIAEAHLLAGRPRDARSVLRDLQDRTAESDMATPNRQLAWLALASDDHTGALVHANAALDAAVVANNPYEEALALLTRDAAHVDGDSAARSRARELLDHLGVARLEVPWRR